MANETPRIWSARSAQDAENPQSSLSLSLSIYSIIYITAQSITAILFFNYFFMDVCSSGGWSNHTSVVFKSGAREKTVTIGPRLRGRKGEPRTQSGRGGQMELSPRTHPIFLFLESSKPLPATSTLNRESRVPYEQHVTLEGTMPSVGKEGEWGGGERAVMGKNQTCDRV